MNEKLIALIEATGQMAELVKMQFDAFRNAGFTEQQALYLSGDFIAALLTTENGGNADE